MEDMSLEDVAMGKKPKAKKKMVKEPKIGPKAKAKITKIENMTMMLEKANMNMLSGFSEEEVEDMLRAHRELSRSQSIVMDMLRETKSRYERAERKKAGKDTSCGYSY